MIDKITNFIFSSKFKFLFYYTVHVLFISQLVYSFAMFVLTSRENVLDKRLRSLETWTMLFMYMLLILFTVIVDSSVKTRLTKFKTIAKSYKEFLLLMIMLFVFPWATTLVMGHPDLLEFLGFNDIVYRVFGFLALVGSVLFTVLYVTENKFVVRILFYLTAGLMIIPIMVFTYQGFIADTNPVVFGNVPILIFFAYFFYRESRRLSLEKKEELNS